MTFAELENLLAARLGFDIHSVGQKAVENALRRSMKDAGFSDAAAYARMVAENPEAWESLVDKVVIPETWFFRDVAPFELVGNLARAHMRGRSDKVLRILSCPCATGEEPYSLVMAMLQAGAPGGSFTADAVDVNPRALKCAQAAVFNKRSFRDRDPWYREPYFDREANDSWRLKKSIASLVSFRPGNLIEDDFLKDDAPYDIVFCRNLLIYLHPEARMVAIAALRRLVAADGVLVLGHAETAFAREHGFRATGPAAAFAFIRQGEHAAPKPRPATHAYTPTRAAMPPAPVPQAPAPPAPAAGPDAGQDADLSLLIIARQLGDAGELQDALRLCSEHLQRVPDSPEGHFLLGVLHDALGHHDLAAGCFRKVLYLNPAHRDALLHLALKQEARGDGSGAALLRARARRSPDDCTTD